MSQPSEFAKPQSGKNTIHNHFSPRFTNKPWADNNGLIVKFSRRADRTIVRGRTGPKEWGAENYLYSQDLEDSLERFETLISPIYKKLLQDEVLHPTERLLWGHWLLCQYSRTPSFMIEFAKLPEDLLFRHAAPDFADLLDTETQIKAAQSHITDFATSKKLVYFLVLRDWVTFRAPQGEFFIKSDVPVIIQGPLVEESTTILYPLSPDKCFSATVVGGVFPPRQLQLEQQLEPGRSLEVVRLIASTADREVICHPQHDSAELRALLSAHLSTESIYPRLGVTPE